MSFSRLPYDTCSYEYQLAYTTGPGMYQLVTPNNVCEPCHASDPYIRLQSQGVSICKNTSLVDVDSELIGISRYLSDCPDRSYLPTGNLNMSCGAQSGASLPGCQPSAKLCVDNTNMMHFKNCFSNTEDTRLSNPPSTLRGTGWNRWEWLCRDPQDRVLIPYDYQINSKIVFKDNHRPCLPNPVNQFASWPVPTNTPICDTIVPVAHVPTEPPSVHWQCEKNIINY